MADISKIVLGSTTYNIKDTVARAAMTGGMHFLGVSLSEIEDAKSNVAIIKTGTNTANRYYTGTAPTDTTYTSGGTTYTLKNIALTAGDVVIYGRLEFVFSNSDNCWHELGSTGSLGKLAYNDTVTVKYDKATGGTLVGTKATISVSGSTSGVKVSSHSYTPEGSISGTVTIGEPGTTTVVRGVNTSKLTTTTVHDTPTISAPTDTLTVNTGTVTASTADVAIANATATSVLTGLTGTTTFVTAIDAVKASYANETLTLAAATTSKNTVTASNANLTGVSGTKTVLTELTGTRTFATGLKNAAGTAKTSFTYVTNASLTAGTSKTVATGSVDSNGTGAIIATGVPNDGYADAITSLGIPTFSGSFTGTTATIDHTVAQGSVTASGSYTPQGSVTITNTPTTVTATASK